MKARSAITRSAITRSLKARPMRPSQRWRPEFRCRGRARCGGPGIAARIGPGRRRQRGSAGRSHAIAKTVRTAAGTRHAGLAHAGWRVVSPGPDLASLGYERLTAVYDITAHAVYLPNGLSLEAHSGMGSLRDDPEHVSVPNVGATPPAVYELKPREKLFHGVQALRMIPTEGSDTSGRSGLLAHSFMLGPNGDFERLRLDQELRPISSKPSTTDEINRLVVVPSLSGATLASQRSTSQS